MSENWDLVVVGAGPAGASAALAALQRRPDARVLLLDREDFPRDKSCGDGIAPHVSDVLDSLGLPGVVDDHEPVWRLQLGYLPSVAIFGAAIAVPAVGWRFFRLNPVVAFWVAYVLTRPLGASFADWLGKPASHGGGLGLGDGPVAGVAALVIAVLVTYLALRRDDVQRRSLVSRAVGGTRMEISPLGRDGKLVGAAELAFEPVLGTV